MKVRFAGFAMIGVAAIFVLFGSVRGPMVFAQKVTAPTRSVWDGVYHSAQADRGEGQRL